MTDTSRPDRLATLICFLNALEGYGPVAQHLHHPRGFDCDVAGICLRKDPLAGVTVVLDDDGIDVRVGTLEHPRSHVVYPFTHAGIDRAISDIDAMIGAWLVDEALGLV